MFFFFDRLLKNLLQSAIGLGAFLSFIMVIIKSLAWWKSKSMSIGGSLLDSVIDCFTSLMNFFVLRYARSPADKEHRFGHGKAEAIASLAQAPILLLSGLYFSGQSAYRLMVPQALIIDGWCLAIMGISTFITLIIVLAQQYTLRRYDSLILKTDNLHYRADMLLNIGVFISIYISRTWHVVWIDSIAGICLGLYITYTGYDVAKDALNMLMDKELDDNTREIILDQAKQHPNVMDVHDLRTRDASGQYFIQLHLVMDAFISLSDAHKIVVEVEKKIRAILPKADILIHADPDNDQDNH